MDKLKFKLIRLYREEQCLWDPNDPLFTSVVERHKAYVNIREELSNMGLPMTLKEIQNKIRLLKAAYFRTRKMLRKGRSIKPISSTNTARMSYKVRIKCFRKMDRFLKSVRDTRMRRKPLVDYVPTFRPNYQ